MIPPPTNVSRSRDHPFMKNVISNKALGAPRGETFLRKNPFPSSPFPKVTNISRAEGLGLDGTNRSQNLTVRSPSLPEYDYYTTYKGTSGIPIFTYKHEIGIRPDDDYRCDLTQLNFRMEQATIEEKSRFDARPPLKATKRKNAVDQYGATKSSIGGPGSEMWPQGFGTKNVSTELTGMESNETDMISFWKNYGDIGLDFMRKWMLQGFTVTMVDENGVSDNSDLRMAATATRSIVLSHGGDTEVKNLFSSRVSVGDRLYFVVAPTHVGHLGNFCMRPDGTFSEAAVPYDGNCIQIRGVSSADGFDPSTVMISENPVRKACAESRHKSGLIGASGNEPFATDYSLDIDYTTKERLMKAECVIFDAADSLNEPSFRRVSHIEEVPEYDILMEVYSSGHVIPVGHVSQPSYNRPSSDIIAKAHRNSNILKGLPALRVIYMPN